MLLLEEDRKRCTLLILAFGTGKLAVISILLSCPRDFRSAVLMKRQVICIFLPLPSSAMITLPYALSTTGEAIINPFAPISWATFALFVNEHV